MRSLKYDSVKGLLSPEQRAYLEGAPKERRAPRRRTPEPAPKNSSWRNCVQGCMGGTGAVHRCDVCGGEMVPGQTNGRK